MTMKNLYLLTLLIGMISSVASAQTEETNAVAEGKKQPRLNENTMVFKFSPLQMIVGELNFGFEAQTSKKTSVEVELGPTLSQVGFAGIKFEDSGENVSESSDLGVFGSFGFRYYPLDKTEALNRIYISPVLKFRLYNSKLRELSGNLSDIRETNMQAKFLFNFGYQLWASKSFAFDFFIGTGFGYRQITSYKAIVVYENFENNYVWDRTVSESPQFVMNLGVKIGLGR